MNARDMIEAFANAETSLPVETLEAAAAQWDVVAPDMLAILTAFADGSNRSHERETALFFILHLMGQMKEKRAFKPLCRLCRDPEAVIDVLDDGVMETLPGILISTWDGDLDALKSVIEYDGTDDYVPIAGLNALAYLTAVGEVERDTTRICLQTLYEAEPWMEESLVWAEWALTVARLDFGDLVPLVEQAMERGLVDTLMVDMNEFNDTLARARKIGDPLILLAVEGIGPLDDAVETLSDWECFTEEDEPEPEPVSSLWASPSRTPPAPQMPPVTEHDQFRNVGRNDPCPCGSGKKYKKCCLQ